MDWKCKPLNFNFTKSITSITDLSLQPLFGLDQPSYNLHLQQSDVSLSVNGSTNSCLTTMTTSQRFID